MVSPKKNFYACIAFKQETICTHFVCMLRISLSAPSDETLHLLATSYYRSGSVKHAHSVLQKHAPVNSHCKYLMAKCCSDLNKYVIMRSL